MNPNHTQPAGNCEAIQELIPAYAFGLTDPEETRFVEANIDACADAAAQLADFQQLQNEMRASVPQIDPPAAMTDRLIAVMAAPETPAKPKRAPIRLSWLAAAAALIALALTNVYWLTRVNTLQQQQADYLAHDNDDNGTGLPGSAFVLTSTSDLRWVRLQASQQDGKASGFLCWNADSQTGLLYVWGFPAVTAGQTYQLWLMRDNVPTSAGTFSIDVSGKTVLLFHASQPIEDYAWARITTEPQSGSTQPSDNAIVAAQL